MKINGWLIITKTGRISRVVQSLPSLKMSEYATKLELNVSESVFIRQYPVIKADLSSDSFVKPTAIVEVEEVDDDKLAEDIHAKFTTAGEEFSLEEVKEFIKNRRSIDEQAAALERFQSKYPKGWKK